MAYWDSKAGTVFYHDPTPYPGHEDTWQLIDCGCCSGIEWGGEYPRECRRCGGGGYLAKHVESGALAWYPGGPFCGQA